MKNKCPLCGKNSIPIENLTDVQLRNKKATFVRWIKKMDEELEIRRKLKNEKSR